MAANIAEVNLQDPAGRMVEGRFVDFIREFAVDVEIGGSGSTQDTQRHRVHEYLLQIQQWKENDESTLYVDFSHLHEHDLHLAATILEEYYRFDPFLRKAVGDLHKETATDEEDASKDCFVAFYNLQAPFKIRELKMNNIGCLVSFNGTVTRTSEVRPELLYGSFRCEECGTITGNIEQQFKYTTPSRCSNPQCSNRSQWDLVIAQSRFVDWQRVRVQENADEIPPGSMPRSVDVILRQGAVEKAKAGDKCTFTGTLVVVPDVAALGRPGRVAQSRRSARSDRSGTGAIIEGVTGLKELGVRDLTYKTAFIACSVTRDGQQGLSGSREGDDSAEAAAEEFTEEEAREFRSQVEQHPDTFYHRMVRSIAPTVFGHEEVKRGVLLMLLGGVHKTTGEGIKLRGDINVCIVGDPSVAKSQFLKYTVKFLPRAVYTSGKASSAAGLTASVSKDPETGEFTIEAGALMLADNGVCCIDEFDKMDPADQVAIHEAMEQQTISITKAGIQATLNARTSILAAANPIQGRYDRSKTLRQNVTISPPIMSRFDLFFVVLDECDETSDYSIAKHIVGVHQKRERSIEADYDGDFMRRFVRYARTIQPRITQEAQQKIVSCYTKLRTADASGMSQAAYRITVRQLESLIRLSEALARVHLSEEVRPEYVAEAYRLLKKSVIHVETGKVELDGDLDQGFAEPDDGASGGDRTPPRGGGGGRGGGASAGAGGQAGGADDDDDDDDDDAPAAGAGASQAQSPRKQQQPQRTQIDFEEYQRIVLQVAHWIREQARLAEEAQDAEAGGGTQPLSLQAQSLRQQEVVEWYLEQHAADLDDLAAKRRLINKIIQRLIVKEGVLVVVRDGIQASAAEAKGVTDMELQEARSIAVHPDIVLPGEAPPSQEFDA